MNVGVAGLGKMGAAMALRLIEVGHQVTVWNRSADKAKPLAAAGATVAATPAELASCCEAIITILTDAAAIDAVYDGPTGLLAGEVRDKLFIEMSTVQPATEICARRQGPRQRRRYSSNVRSAVRPVRRGRASSSLSWAPSRSMPIARIRCCGSCAGGSSIAVRSAPARP